MTARPLPDRAFCLIRHGETTANAAAIIAGSTDVPLTARGQAQARALALRAWPTDIVIHASPLCRAEATARLAFPGRRVRPHPGLRERDWGAFEGRPLAELPARDATPQQGESWPDMLARVQAAITGICAAPGAALPVLVCHSGVIRAVRVLWTTGDVGTRPPNALPLLFRKAGDRLRETRL